MRIEKYKNKYWAVYDEYGSMICVCLYKKGAMNVAKLIQALLQQKEVTSSV
ncbi:MAG: hypothetical protein PHC44_04690 [Lutispora sp.]|nr:hypothetical protein [Lutispora sp.]